MSKIDLSVKVKLTPTQAVAILVAMDDWPLGWPKKMESAHNGAESRVRNALMDAGWHFDGTYWVKDDGTP